ncbi:hypothetical protein L7F22_032735 [Adiantum nelumboides]|nr:hypothetical protein [Adiantum nelumboides]
MAIKLLSIAPPFIAEDSSTLASLLHNCGNGDSDGGGDTDLDLSEEDVWEAAAMAASCVCCSLQLHNDFIISSPPGSSKRSCEMAEASLSAPMRIPMARYGSRLVLQDTDNREDEEEDNGDLYGRGHGHNRETFYQDAGKTDHVSKGRPLFNTDINVDLVAKRWQHQDSDIINHVSKRWQHSKPWAAPHEIAARERSTSRQQVMAFSMVDGHGRTLKGRDLTNLRNAVWHTIGFAE